MSRLREFFPMQVSCTQCGAAVQVAQGIRFFVCSYCNSALYLDPSRTVFHFVISPLVSSEESLGKLKRWMAGNETAKDLDIRAQITDHRLIYFPMWRFLSVQPAGEREYTEPAASFVIPDIQKIPLSGGHLKFFHPDEFAGMPLLEPDVLLDSALQWLSSKGISKESIKETNLIHIPFYIFEYVFQNENYKAAVDGISGRVLAAIYPAKVELPFIGLTLAASFLFFLEGLIAPDAFIRFLLYALTAIPLSIGAYVVLKKF